MENKEAIEYLLYAKHNVDAKSPLDVAYDTAIEALKAQDANRWISCQERLPDNIGAVLITRANRKPEQYQQGVKDKPFVCAAHYCNGKWWWDSATCEDYLAEYGHSDVDAMDNDIDVLAWMPLPDAYNPPEKD